MRRSIHARGAVVLATASLAALSAVAVSAPAQARTGVRFHPTVSDYAQVSASETPPTEAQCFSVAGKKIVPELIQGDFTPENVVREVMALLPDGAARQQMQNALKMVQDRLRDREDEDPPALKAAKEIMQGLA